MKTVLILTCFVFLAETAHAQPVGDLVCSYAPSQSEMVSRISGAAGGAGVTAAAITQATGLTAVVHSSGAYIFTGSGGYVAGTLGGGGSRPSYHWRKYYSRSSCGNS